MSITKSRLTRNTEAAYRRSGEYNPDEEGRIVFELPIHPGVPGDPTLNGLTELLIDPLDALIAKYWQDPNTTNLPLHPAGLMITDGTFNCSDADRTDICAFRSFVVGDWRDDTTVHSDRMEYYAAGKWDSPNSGSVPLIGAAPFTPSLQTNPPGYQRNIVHTEDGVFVSESFAPNDLQGIIEANGITVFTASYTDKTEAQSLFGAPKGEGLEDQSLLGIFRTRKASLEPLYKTVDFSDTAAVVIAGAAHTKQYDLTYVSSAGNEGHGQVSRDGGWKELFDEGYGDNIVMVTGIAIGNDPYPSFQEQARTITMPYINGGSSGTSRATALFGGIICLMQQVTGLPSASIADGLLQTATKDFPGYTRETHGVGLIDLPAAFRSFKIDIT